MAMKICSACRVEVHETRIASKGAPSAGGTMNVWRHCDENETRMCERGVPIVPATRNEISGKPCEKDGPAPAWAEPWKDWPFVKSVEGSDPEYPYDLTRDPVSGAWGCSCPSYKFSKSSPKSCKHTRAEAEAV